MNERAPITSRIALSSLAPRPRGRNPGIFAKRLDEDEIRDDERWQSISLLLCYASSVFRHAAFSADENVTAPQLLPRRKVLTKLRYFSQRDATDHESILLGARCGFTDSPESWISLPANKAVVFFKPSKTIINPVSRAMDSAVAGDHQPIRFVPSENLTSLVQRGFKALVEVMDKTESDIIEADLDVDISQAEVAETITTRIERMLATIGGRESFGGAKEVAISNQGRFSLRIQHEILDRLPVRPDEGTDFFTALYSEVVSHLRQGGRIGGAWGEVVERQGELYLRIKPAEVVSGGGWEPLSRLEGDFDQEY